MATKTEELLQAIIAGQPPFNYARLAKYHESAIQSAATAALVVRPSDTAAITVYNNSKKGEVLVIDREFSFQLVSTTADAFSGLWYCNHKNMALPTNDITTLRGTGDGRIAENASRHVIVDVGASVLDDGWFPVGDASGQVEATGVLPGSNLSSRDELTGKIIVYPGGGISGQVVSGVTGNTFTTGFSWWRIPASLAIELGLGV